MNGFKTHNKIKKLRMENKALRETLEILSNKKAISDIKISLQQIKEGKTHPLSNL